MPEPPASPEEQETIALPHPMALSLIERLGHAGGARILDFASGSGRNTDALRRAGFAVVAINDASASAVPPPEITGEFAAALSTHGFLHGTPSLIAERVQCVAERLVAGGLLYAAFGSTRDARFGQGERIDAFTFAPTSGDEHGVAHGFFDREQLWRLLGRHFAIESLAERSVDKIAGSWAHRESPLAGAVHWFAVAQKR